MSKLVILCILLCVIGCASQDQSSRKAGIASLETANRLCGEHSKYLDGKFDITGKSEEKVKGYMSCMEKGVPQKAPIFQVAALLWVGIFEGNTTQADAQSIWETAMNNSRAPSSDNAPDFFDKLLTAAIQYNASHPTMNCTTTGMGPGQMSCN